MNILLNRFLLAAYIAVAAFSTNVSAAPVVIDFGTGLGGSGGTIDDILGDGTHIIGRDINIGSLEAVGTGNDGVYIANAFLNFDTGLNTIEVNGTISGLGINAPIELLSGSFTEWTYTEPSAISRVFSGSGIDTIEGILLNKLGVSPDTEFNFFGFSLGYDFTGDGATAISTDIMNTSIVPVPPAVWLFGAGLIGLAGIARRKA